MFKKVKFQLAQGNCVNTYECKNKSIDDIVEIIKNPNMISLSVVKMTPAQYLKGKKQ
jgi:hypothetical protein